MSSTTLEIKPKAVRAGAGAGKTHNLTHQVLDFALAFKEKNERWPHIMVTTFTRKATQELSERLIKLSLSEKPETLEFTTSSLFLKVSTIHGILDHFLKQYGHHIDLCGDFTYFKNSESDFISKKILKETLESNPDLKDLLETYTFSRLHSMLQEVSTKDLKGYKPLSKQDLLIILEKKTLELRKNISLLVDRINHFELPEIWSEVKGILEKVYIYLNPEAYSESYQDLLVLIEQFNLRKSYGQKKNENAAFLYEEFKSLVAHLRKLSENVYDPNGFDFYISANQKFSDLKDIFTEQLNRTKKSLGKIDLSDLESFSLELIRHHHFVAKKFSQEWDYWLIDEFQDTSPVQVEILNTLIGNKPYYVVGDPQQSIYLFRGARSEVFRDKFLEIETRDGELDILNTNYRSTASLLHFINHLSNSLDGEFQSMVPCEKAEKAEQVCMIRDLQTEDKISGDELELAGLGEYLINLSDDGIQFGEVAILGRKHKDLEEVAKYLKSKNIPVHLHSGGGFWKRREVLDTLVLLKFLVNPHDDFNLASLLRMPLIAIKETEIVNVFQNREESAWRKFRLLAEKGQFGESGKKLIKWYDKRNRHGLVVCFQRLLVELGFFDTHVHLDSSERIEGNLWKFIHLLKAFERERGANFVQFINEAERSSGREKEADAIGAVDANKVNIMTVHASKGLQFNYVFLPFLGKAPYIENKIDVAIDEDEKIWSVRAPSSADEIKTSASLFEKNLLIKQKEKELQENLRVFYVAYTRAKKGLYLSWCHPIKETSWAHQLKNLDLKPGRHSHKNFEYKVSNEVRDIDTVIFVPTDNSIPAPMMDIRHSFPQDETEGATAVTQRVRDEKLTTYKHSFLNKQRGILFHKLLETLKYPGSADIRELITNWFPDDQEEVSKAINYLLTVDEVPIVRLIKEGHVEWSFVTYIDEQRTEGQVDLWGVIDNTLWVADYKSGKKVLADKAFKQLTLYSQALTKYLDWQGEVKLAVIYPFVEECLIQSVL